MEYFRFARGVTMLTFLQWTEAMMWSGKDGYDTGLQSDVGLAYRSPKIPDRKSRLSKLLDKMFGKKKSKSDSGTVR